MIILAQGRRWSGVDQTTPIEGGASASGGAVAVSTALPWPSVVKTTSGGIILCRAGVAVAGSPTLNFSLINSGGAAWTFQSQGPIASPNLAKNGIYQQFEVTVNAPGTITVPAPTTPNSSNGGTVSSWAQRVSVIRPAVVGTAPVMVASITLVNANASPVSIAFASAPAVGNFLHVDFEIDDPAVAVTPPSGWTQAYRQTHAGGVLVGYYKIATDTTNSFSFSFATSSVPTVNSAAVISAAHNPALVGDTVNVDTNTSYTAPGGDPVTLYERRPQRNTGSGWADITSSGSPISYTANTQGALSTYTLVSADDGAQVRYASRAQNGAGFSDWSYSNQISVLNAPVVATAPAIQTDGTPNDGDTVTVDVSGGARSTRYSGQAIDAYETKWQDDTGGSYADLAGTGGTSSLLLTSAQVSHNVRFAERAHNASGYSAWNYSAPIAVLAHSPLAATDIKVRFSGGTNNADGSLSIGGARGAIYDESSPGALLNELFGPVLGTLASAGGDEYRGIYLENGHTLDVWQSVMAYIGAQPVGQTGVTYAVAVPTETAGQALAALASGTTAPSGVTWITATTKGSGGALGSIPANGGYRGVWVRRRVAASTPLDSVGHSGTLSFEEA